MEAKCVVGKFKPPKEIGLTSLHKLCRFHIQPIGNIGDS